MIGIWPRHPLVDGTETTQPEFSFWFNDVGWGVENYGTDPDIEVDNAPQDARGGRDRQLETALATALDLVADARSRAFPTSARGRSSRAGRCRRESAERGKGGTNRVRSHTAGYVQGSRIACTSSTCDPT